MMPRKHIIKYSTLKFKARIRKGGHKRLDEVLRESGKLYNAARAHWIDAYHRGEDVGFYAQAKEFTQIRKADPDFWGEISRGVGLGVLMHFGRARSHYLKRARAGKKPELPQYKNIHRYRTISVFEPTKFSLKSAGKNMKLYIKGLPTIYFKPNNELPDDEFLKCVHITRYPTGYYVGLRYCEKVKPSEPTRQIIGIDMGVSNRMALSDGTYIRSAHVDRKKDKRLHRKLSRAEIGSKSHAKKRLQLARERHRMRVRHRNLCHRITSKIVSEHDLVCIEDLPVQNISRSGKNKGKRTLNRRVRDQMWGTLRTQMTYKSMWAGKKLIAVNPHKTSQKCSQCGNIEKSSRKHGTYRCSVCKLSINIDTNAAINILRLGLASQGRAGRPPVRPARLKVKTRKGS